MKDANQLLDLLSVSDESAIEQTRAAAAGRGALYPDVRIFFVPSNSVADFLNRE